MPTYDYECRSCGHTEEVFQSIKDDALTTCPGCGKDEFRRLISAGVGIIFKGSGFYVTDSKKSSTSSTTKESSKSTDSSSSSDSSADTKASSSDKKKSEPAKTTEKAS